jgi:hypothetical protein
MLNWSRAVRECQVSFYDRRGVRHSITVEASSVLEAAGLGLKRVREQNILDDDLGFSDVTVEVATKSVQWCPSTNCLNGVILTRQARAS